MRWTTKGGDSGSTPGADLLPASPWRLCAQDNTCVSERLVELHELAKGRGSTGQAAILADRVVTEGEYRSALRSWGGCIAMSTGADVTFDDDGLFTIPASGDQVELEFEFEFERCMNTHIALVAEAIGLVGTADGD